MQHCYARLALPFVAHAPPSVKGIMRSIIVVIARKFAADAPKNVVRWWK